MRRIALGFLLLTACLSFGQEGWSRYRVTARNAAEARRIDDCSLGLFSDNVVIGETDVIVGPGQLPELYRLRLPASFVQTLPDPRDWYQNHNNPTDDYTNQYLRYDAIIAQYETWRLLYPGLISRQSIGTTWGGRTVWAYKFVYPWNDRQIDNSYVVICGIHAREWISPSVGLYLMDRLVVTTFTRHPFTSRVPPRTAFYIVPVLNPDGYEYCWTNNRMWRKNRRNNGDGTFGVDLNRNFSKAWGGSGSSGNTGSETYRGPSAFSEPETNGFRQFLAAIPNPRGFIDFHSYGQLVLWPWAYTTALAPGDPWFRVAGLAAKQAIFDTNGKTYDAGPSSTTLYISSGSSKDYLYDQYNSAAYSIELRDTGQFGFLLPENQILGTQTEAWAAFQELVARMLIR